MSHRGGRKEPEERKPGKIARDGNVFPGIIVGLIALCLIALAVVIALY